MVEANLHIIFPMRGFLGLLVWCYWDLNNNKYMIIMIVPLFFGVKFYLRRENVVT